MSIDREDLALKSSLVLLGGRTGLIARPWSLDISQHSSSGAVNEARRPGWELLGVLPPERGADWKTPSWRSEGRALRLRRTLGNHGCETQILDQPQTSGHEHVHDHVNVHVDVHVSVDVAVIGFGPQPGVRLTLRAYGPIKGRQPLPG